MKAFVREFVWSALTETAMCLLFLGALVAAWFEDVILGSFDHEPPPRLLFEEDSDEDTSTAGGAPTAGPGGAG